MATHDYVIDNQSASSFRSDLNNVLQAIVTQNSSATAPTTTYADMIWYDTANNQLKKRNEANSGWITLGTIDEGTGTFTPSGERALASQAEAEAGTDNTKLMTPLRTEQHMTANALGWGQTWQSVSRTAGVSYQNTTSRPIQVSIKTGGSGSAIQVSPNNATWLTVDQNDSADYGHSSAIIPVNYYYRVTTTAPQIWVELR